MNQSDPPPLPSVLGRLLTTARSVEARLEAELAELDLSLAKAKVLRILSQEDGPQALSRLAERGHCVKSNITQLVDRLEADGLVRRTEDPSDGRIRLASLTAQGQRVCRRAVEIIQHHERLVAEALSDRDAATLARVLDRLQAQSGTPEGRIAPS